MNMQSRTLAVIVTCLCFPCQCDSAVLTPGSVHMKIESDRKALADIWKTWLYMTEGKLANHRNDTRLTWRLFHNHGIANMSSDIESSKKLNNGNKYLNVTVERTTAVIPVTSQTSSKSTSRVAYTASSTTAQERVRGNQQTSTSKVSPQTTTQSQHNLATTIAGTMSDVSKPNPAQPRENHVGDASEKGLRERSAGMENDSSTDNIKHTTRNTLHNFTAENVSLSTVSLAPKTQVEKTTLAVSTVSPFGGTDHSKSEHDKTTSDISTGSVSTETPVSYTPSTRLHSIVTTESVTLSPGNKGRSSCFYGSKIK